MQFQLTYQQQPYCNSQPSAIVVEAETRADAYITAADTLIRRGRVMSFGDGDRVLSADEMDEVKAAFPNYPVSCGTAIRSLIEYKPPVRGKVLQG